MNEIADAREAVEMIENFAPELSEYCDRIRRGLRQRCCCLCKEGIVQDAQAQVCPTCLDAFELRIPE